MPIKPSSFRQGPKTLRQNYQDRLTTVGLGTQKNCLMWGLNNYAQLGLNDVVPRSSPLFIGGSDWIHVASSNYESLGVKNDGTLWAWGYNAYGQLGQNSLVYYSSPVQVTNGTDWDDFSFIEYTNPNQYQIFQKQDKTLWAMGHGAYGQLGVGDGANYSSPVQLTSLGAKEWNTLTITNHSSIGIAKTDKSLWAWGYNPHGAFGVINGAYNQPQSSPVQVDLGEWIDASTGTYTFVGIKTDGTLWASGYNNHGQLGTNDTVPRSSPTQIGTQTDWQKVSVEGNHVAAIRSGNLYTWGYNNHGQLGLGDLTPRSSPNHASYGHTNGLIKDVRAIHQTTYMQVGIATITGINQWYAVGHDSSYQHIMDGMRSEGTGDIPRSSPVPVGPYWSEFIYNDNSNALEYFDYDMYFYTNNTVALNRAN